MDLTLQSLQIAMTTGFANNIRYLGANLSQIKCIKNVNQLTPNDNLWEKHQQSYSSALEKDLCLNLLTELSTIRSTKHVNFTNKCTQHYSFQYSNTRSLNNVLETANSASMDGAQNAHRLNHLFKKSTKNKLKLSCWHCIWRQISPNLCISNVSWAFPLLFQIQ